MNARAVGGGRSPTPDDNVTYKRTLPQLTTLVTQQQRLHISAQPALKPEHPLRMRGLSAAAEAPPQTTVWQLPNNNTLHDSALRRNIHMLTHRTASPTRTNTWSSEGGDSEGSDEGGGEGGANGGISTAAVVEATAEMKAARAAASTAAYTEEQ